MTSSDQFIQGPSLAPAMFLLCLLGKISQSCGYLLESNGPTLLVIKGLEDLGRNRILLLFGEGFQSPHCVFEQAGHDFKIALFRARVAASRPLDS